MPYDIFNWSLGGVKRYPLCWKTEVCVGIPDQFCITVNQRRSDSQLLHDSLQYIAPLQISVFFAWKSIHSFLPVKVFFICLNRRDVLKLISRHYWMWGLCFLFVITVRTQLAALSCWDLWLCSEISGAQNPFLIPVRGLPAQVCGLSQKYLSQNY